jgi:hypothetical protein
MQHMHEQPYRELRALFDHLVDTVDAVQQQLGKDHPQLSALDDVMRQAHAYQQAACERCGVAFTQSTLHAESYAAGGYSRVCPRCNRELGGQS